MYSHLSLSAAKQEFTFNSEEETLNFAKNLSRLINKGDILTFNGDLGSGKTFICRAIIKNFCGDHTNVVSPTFNLLQTYQAKLFEIYHLDLYRLKDPSEAFELGIDDTSDKVCLIEWPEIVNHTLQKNHLTNIDIKIVDKNIRKIIVTSGLI